MAGWSRLHGLCRDRGARRGRTAEQQLTTSVKTEGLQTLQSDDGRGTSEFLCLPQLLTLHGLLRWFCGIVEERQVVKVLCWALRGRHAFSRLCGAGRLWIRQSMYGRPWVHIVPTKAVIFHPRHLCSHHTGKLADQGSGRHDRSCAPHRNATTATQVTGSLCSPSDDCTPSVSTCGGNFWVAVSCSLSCSGGLCD